MGLTRKTSKFTLISMVIAGMTMSSCSLNSGSSSSGGGIGKKIKDGVHAIEHGAHEAWDYLTGKQPKWKREQAVKNAEHVANWPQTLSHVNIKGLPKIVIQCYKDASALSGVPLPVMYAITLNETGFYPHSVLANDGLEGRVWDCGIMQDNTYWMVCPLANRLAHHMTVVSYAYDNKYSGLLSEIEALGFKYIGGGSSDGNCDNLNHAETVDYCRELDLSPERVGMRGRPYIFEHYGPPLTSNPVCLGVFMGAYALSYYMWDITHSSTAYNNALSSAESSGGGAYEDALQKSGPYSNWVLVAYMYNGVIDCSGLGCYYDKFARHLHGVLTGAIHIGSDIAHML